MIYQLSISNELSTPSHFQQTPNRIVEASKLFRRCGASIPVPLACEARALPFQLRSVLFKLRASFWTKFMKYQLSICNELSILYFCQPEQNRIVEASISFWDAGHRSTHLSHAKRALYHFSYVPVLFKLRASFWTKFMKYQLSICNELSILSFCQPEQNRIVEASKMYWDAGHRSTDLSHAKRALYHFSYVPVLFKLRASFWTKSMIYQLSISNELSTPSHYQQTPNRIVEASKSFGDAGHRSTHLSHAKRSLYHLRYIPVLFKLGASFEQNSWNIFFLL